MMRLRPYKPSDAKNLLTWWTGVPEDIFVMWSNGKFEYPLTMEQLDSYFQTWCLEEENGWLMTALDEAGVPVGHVMMRLADYQAESIRFGFIIVDPDARGKGYGKALLKELAKITIDRGCGRLEWCCLDWNKPSIDFYLSLDARPMSEWTTYRLSGETLEALAKMQ